MPIFPLLRSLLWEDDTMLAMSNAELLDVEASKGLWRRFNNDADELTPRQRLQPFALFVSRLYDLSQQMEDLSFLPYPKSPECAYTFKTNENIILGFCGDNPVWCWKKKDDLWQLYAMQVSRNSHIEDHFDLDEEVYQE